MKGLVAAVGKPDAARTWSGTPRHIVTALSEQCDGQITGLDLRGASLLSLVARLVARARWLVKATEPRALLALNWSSTLRRQLRVQAYDWVLIMGSGGRRVESAIPTFLLMDSTIPLWSRLGGWHPSELEFRLAVRWEAECVRRATHVFVISHWVKNSIVADYGVDAQRVTVIHTGYEGEGERFAHGDYSQRRLLFVGKEGERKGLASVIRMFQALKRMLPDATLTVVSDTGRTHLPGVTFLKGVTRQHLDQLYSEASVFIMPAYYEPWGLVYLEAMSHGTPILLNREQAMAHELDLLGCSGGSIRVADNADALLRATYEELRDPSNLAKRGALARSAAQLFSWQRTAGMIRAVAVDHLALKGAQN